MIVLGRAMPVLSGDVFQEKVEGSANKRLPLDHMARTPRLGFRVYSFARVEVEKSYTSLYSSSLSNRLLGAGLSQVRTKPGTEPVLECRFVVRFRSRGGGETGLHDGVFGLINLFDTSSKTRRQQ